MPNISFIILTFNSSKHIDSLFDSLNSQIGEKVDRGIYEIIIYDNNSTDNTLELTHKYIKKNIFSYQDEENLGYAKGINKASKKARGEYLIVINPDSKIVESNFDDAVAEFEKNKTYAIAGFKIRNFEGKDEKNAGKFYNIFTFLLFAFGLENIFSLRFSPSVKTEVDYVSGGFIMFRKNYFNELNGYDEDYFMYVEDMDICYRAKRKGFKVVFFPYAVIEHKGQGSSSREFAIVNIYKGLSNYYHKNSSPIMEYYVKNLLSIKAALIIFIASLLGKEDLLSTYSKALKTIS